jgi:spore coat protein U-like protein
MKTGSHHPLWPGSMLWLAALALLAFAGGAQAQITCTISSPGGFSTAYSGTGSPLNITATNVTVNCFRNNGGPNVATRTATYQLAASLSGQQLAGQRRARLGATANYLNYNLTSDLGCSTLWQGTGYLPTALYTTPGLAKGQTDSHIFNFWGCVPANQTVPAAGTYRDTYNITFVNRTVSGGPSTFSNAGGAGQTVTIVAPASCSSASFSGSMVFNYAAFGAAAAANITFTTTCNTGLPYTFSLDAGGTGYTGSFTSPTGTYSNTATNLNYTLTLPTPVTGTGVAQTYTITGNMAAGQGGTCAAATCTVTDTHTLTITY